MLIGAVNIYLFIFLSLFVIRNFRGTCSFNEMLKGYMAVESLQILVLKFKPMVPNRWAMAHRCFFGRPWRHCAFWYVQIH